MYSYLMDLSAQRTRDARQYRFGYGIKPEGAEDVFAIKPIFRRTKKGHYVVFGPTSEGRYLSIVFNLKPKGLARPITGWDMSRTEIRYYKKRIADYIRNLNFNGKI